MLLFYLQYNKGAGGSRQGQLTGRGGNRRLLLAALNNRDFVVWTGHFVSFGNWWMGWRFTTSFWAEKKQATFFRFPARWCRCVGGGYLIVKVRGKLTRCEADKLEVVKENCSSIPQYCHSHHRM